MRLSQADLSIHSLCPVFPFYNNHIDITSYAQKARQIRSTPFTEESAESSEDEGTSDQEGTPATPRTIARRLNQSSSGATKRGKCFS